MVLVLVMMVGLEVLEVVLRFLMVMVLVDRPGGTWLHWLLIVRSSALQYLFEILDVVHGLVQNVHFRHFLDQGGGGNVSSEDLEPSVDRLHSVSLSLIPLDGLQVLRRFDSVAVDGMDGH